MFQGHRGTKSSMFTFICLILILFRTLCIYSIVFYQSLAYTNLFIYIYLSLIVDTYPIVRMMIVYTRTKLFDYVSSPLHTEALAAHVGLLLAVERGLQIFLLESDSLQIVIALKVNSQSMSSVVHICGGF